MNSEDESSAGAAQEMPLAGVGGRLRAARETRRLDLEHIAAETRIPLRHLQAIESGNFEALPSRAYAIGFSRTYAKAVGLDEAAITDAVRGELANGSMQRVIPTSGMEPGDPARLPSSGVAWAGALAALILAVGAFAFYNSYFGAGTEPGSLLAPKPAPTPTTAATPSPAATAAVPAGPVVLTATEDGVWLRLYEEGGERLFERALKRGESVTVPATAADPRINTGRPDALVITIGGQVVPGLADQPVTVAGAPVSAAALVARTAAPTPAVTNSPVPTATRAAVRRNSTSAAPAPVPSAAPAADQAPAPTETSAPAGADRITN